MRPETVQWVLRMRDEGRLSTATAMDLLGIEEEEIDKVRTEGGCTRLMDDGLRCGRPSTAYIHDAPNPLGQVGWHHPYQEESMSEETVGTVETRETADVVVAALNWAKMVDEMGGVIGSDQSRALYGAVQRWKARARLDAAPAPSEDPDLEMARRISELLERIAPDRDITIILERGED